MSEEELNKKWLKDELKEFSCSNEFFDKILDLLSKQYINGLEQSRFEKNLLEQENKELKQQLSNSHQMENQQKEFIEYLESEMILFQEYMKEIECSDRCHGDYPITYYTSKCRLNEVTEILSKYKEIIGVKDE